MRSLRGGKGLWLQALPVAILSLGFLWQCQLFRDAKSVTYDESVYLLGGLQIYWRGGFDLLLESGVSPLPILVSQWYPALRNPDDGRSMRASFPARGSLRDPPLVNQARAANAVLVGLGMLLVAYVWLLRRRGLVAACAGAGLIAFSPSILAHSSLATTDACLASATLLALAAMARYQRSPTAGSLVLLGVAVGAVISAKYSGLFIAPVAGYAIARLHFGTPGEDGCIQWPQAALRSGLAMAVVLAIAFFVVVSLHGFDLAGLKTGFLFQLNHVSTGQRGYLLGQVSNQGWWYYFPVAFWAKSSEAELLLALVLVCLVALRLPVLVRLRGDRSLELWLVTIGIYLGSLTLGTINIGHRYLLVVYPVMLVASVDLISEQLRSRPRLFAACAALLVAAQLAAALAVSPHFLAYFNRLVGGPSRGHEYLLDSNLDWGQDLVALRAELDRLRCERVALRYFGTARPEAYGIEATAIRDAREDLSPFDCFAISASYLHGLYDRAGRFVGLRALEPVGRAGHSITIYDLQDPRVAGALAEPATRREKRD